MPRVCYITRAARTGYTSSSSCLCQLPLGEEKLLAAGKTSCALSVQSGADRHAADLIQPYLSQTWTWRLIFDPPIPELFVILREVGLVAFESLVLSPLGASAQVTTLGRDQLYSRQQAKNRRGRAKQGASDRENQSGFN